MKSCTTSEKSFQEQFEQLMLDAAFTELERRELEQVKQLMQTPEMQAEIAASLQRMSGRAYRRMEGQMRRQLWRRQLRVAGRAAARVAAAVGLICFLGIGSLSVAMAGSDDFRVRVFRLIQQQTESYMQWDFVEDEEAAFDVPAGWSGDYYPSYIPDGFVMTEIAAQDAELEPYVLYEHPNGEYFFFSESIPGTSANINTENALTYYLTINGHECFISEFSDSRLNVAWAVEDRYFLLESWTSKEETLKIVAGVLRIR